MSDADEKIWSQRELDEAFKKFRRRLQTELAEAKARIAELEDRSPLRRFVRFLRSLTGAN